MQRCQCVNHSRMAEWHGTLSGYKYHGCRCDNCRDFWNEYHRQYQRQPDERAMQRSRYRLRKPYERTAPSRPRKPRKPTPREIRHEMWADQNGLCALCHKPVPFEESELDHDHSCCNKRVATSCGDCFRGVLHGRCNSMLGFANDSPTLLTQGAEYLGGF